MTSPDNFLFSGKTMLIAICDDGQRELEAIEAALTAAALELSAGIEIAPYPSGAALVEAVKGGARPALAVLDIYMGEENGWRSARPDPRTSLRVPDHQPGFCRRSLFPGRSALHYEARDRRKAQRIAGAVVHPY